MKKSSLKDIFVFGFALFAMFFGAGNLIFPPVLGLTTGDHWFISFLGFFIMDAGLAVLGVLTMLNVQGDMQRVGDPLGHKVSILLSLVTVLCIGPCLGIPRTGAVSFSMAVEPLFGLNSASPLPLLIFSILFFTIVLVLSIKPSKVVGIVGFYLTPVLLLSLLVMISVGIFTGKLEPAEATVASPLKEGIYNGYQTMDGMASLLFSGMMITELLAAENGSESQCRAKIAKASMIAGMLLFIVYGGLTYLGRVWGLPFADLYNSGTIDSAELLALIVESVLGKAGVYIICIGAFFACLTTAIGLTSGCARFFGKLLHDKLSYRTLCILIACIGCGFCNFGLNQIIAIAAPVLNLVYPPITVLILLGLIRTKMPDPLPWYLGTGIAFAISLCGLMCDTFGFQIFSFIHNLPLDSCGLGFAIPSALGVVLAMLWLRTKSKGKA